MVPAGTLDPELVYEYDRFGNRSQLELFENDLPEATHSWGHHLETNLLETADFGHPSGALGLSYYDNDDLKEVNSGALQRRYTYHPHGPLDELEVRYGGTLRNQLDYTLDALSNVTGLAQKFGPGSPPEVWGYDTANRLTWAKPFDPEMASESFRYDSAGNRSMTGYLTDARNRLTADPTLSYGYDADGNLTTITNPPAVETLVWNHNNRLESYTDETPQTWSYRYDAFGRRISKSTLGAVERYYVWDGDALVAEYDGVGARQVRYGYTGGFAPMQVAWTDGSGGEDFYDVHSDPLDTPRLLTDEGGNVVWRNSPDAYGSAVLSSSLGKAFNFRFPGQYYDDESGLHYNRHRYYDPSIGRYVSADPIGQFGALAADGVVPGLGLLPGRGRFISGVGVPHANLYQYAGNNPLMYVDPLGLWSLSVTAFSHGWGGFGGRFTIGSDDSGKFFDATIGVGVGAGISFDPNGQAPIGPQNFDSCEADPDAPVFWVGGGAAGGGILGPFSAGAEGFAGGIVGTDTDGNVVLEYEERGGPEFGVGSVGLGAYGVGGIRIGGSGL